MNDAIDRMSIYSNYSQRRL